MKTYAETQGKQPFDWNAFLAKESYTEEELWEATNIALDMATYTLGDVEGWFYNHVFLMYYNREDKIEIAWHQMIATKALHAIEQRSQENINELNKK
jgi:hypothetical protein